MMGILLLVPFFLIRFGLLARLDREALKRAAYFAPLTKREKAPYWVYQLSNAAIFACLCFLKVRSAPTWLFVAALAVTLAGLLLLLGSVINFASPAENGMNQSGLYRFSRNPMYVAYFVFFTGCALLTQSPLLFAVVLLFQISAHWIIRAEERWCAGQFGEAYLHYMKRVRRYL